MSFEFDRCRSPKCWASPKHVARDEANRNYELDDPNPQDASWANEQIRLTQTVLQAVQNLPAEKLFGETVESIRKYAQEVLKLNVLD